MRIFFLLLILNLNYYSQIEKIDSILDVNTFGLRFEVKNFFIDYSRFKIHEIKPYYKINAQLKLGIGFCFFKYKNLFLNNYTISVNAMNFFASYNWTLSKLFSCETTLDFGLGRLKSNSYNQKIKGFYSFFEPALILNYNDFNFFSLGLGSGFRLTKKDNFIIDDNWSLPTIILRFSLKFSEIYNHFFHPTNTSLYLNND